MEEYGDFRDYDDANMIGRFRRMTPEQQDAVNIIFTYLCGTTFDQIIKKL